MVVLEGLVDTGSKGEVGGVDGAEVGNVARLGDENDCGRNDVGDTIVSRQGLKSKGGENGLGRGFRRSLKLNIS